MTKNELPLTHTKKTNPIGSRVGFCVPFALEIFTFYNYIITRKFQNIYKKEKNIKLCSLFCKQYRKKHY